MTDTAERAPGTGSSLLDLLTPTERAEMAEALERAEGLARAQADIFLQAAAILREEGAVVPLGTFADEPPTGCALKSESIPACRLVIGDRAVPCDRQVVGPAKDAYRHFHRIDALGNLKDGQVLVGWDDEEHEFDGAYPFVRITTGRVETDTFDGPVAHYTWEAQR